jgi:protein-tyrosine phosphatase
MSSDHLSILFVCTGNQCRSALAEVITRSLTEGLPVEVSSAGTDVLGSVPSPKRTLKAASKLGYDLGEHRSRPLADADLDSADLVVGFEIAHVATAVVERGADRSKTWLLPQLVQALEAEPGGSDKGSGNLIAGARARLARAVERRSSAPPMLGDQIADPMGRSALIHQATARTIDDLCKRMTAGLFRGAPGG